MAILEGQVEQLQRDNKEFRMAHAAVRSELDLLKLAFKSADSKTSEYLEFLRQRVADRIKSHNTQR
jgi:hypothetical protein